MSEWRSDAKPPHPPVDVEDMTTPPDTDRCSTSNKVYRCTRRVGHMGDCDFAALRADTPPNNTPTCGRDSDCGLPRGHDGPHALKDGSPLDCPRCNNQGCPTCEPPNNTPGADSVDVEAAQVSRAIMVKYGVHAWLPPKQGDRLEAKYATALSAAYERGKRETLETFAKRVDANRPAPPLERYWEGYDCALDDVIEWLGTKEGG